MSHPFPMVLMWSQRHSQPKRRRPPRRPPGPISSRRSGSCVTSCGVRSRARCRALRPASSSPCSARPNGWRPRGWPCSRPAWSRAGSTPRAGHGTAAEWLGALSGSSAGAAKGRLAAAARAAKDPLLTEALHDGELSVPQLGLVTKTLSETPEASADLLDLMNGGASHQELRDAATQMRAASRSTENERLRRARVHTNRHFRWGQDEHGGIRGGFFCDEVEFARVAPRLEAEAKRRWKAAGNGDGRWRRRWRLLGGPSARCLHRPAGRWPRRFRPRRFRPRWFRPGRRR